jgi:hypothetical protein
MPNNRRVSRSFIVGIALLVILFALGAALTVGGARQWADRPMMHFGIGNQS